MKEHSTSASQMFGLWLNNGIVHAAISNSTGSAYGEANSGTYALSTTQWHMVTSTRSAGVVTLYVNDLNGQGWAPQQQTWSSANVGAVNVDNAGQMTMAENMYTGQFGSPSNFLSGFVDDARVFAYKLDAKQVTSLYSTHARRNAHKARFSFQAEVSSPSTWITASPDAILARHFLIFVRPRCSINSASRRRRLLWRSG